MFRIKAKCTQCMFPKNIASSDNDFRIFQWSPITSATELFVSNYFTFSTKGDDSYISVGMEYELELEEISRSEKWGGTYKIISVPSLMSLDYDNLNYEQSKDILMDCTSSSRLANNILEAYPNFISLVMKEGKEAIDLNKINGVGEAYLNSYVRTINEKYKYYSIMQRFNDYSLTITDCRVLINEYKDEETINKELQYNPYNVLITVLNRGFTTTDRLIMDIRPEFKVTDIRCEYLILDVLKVCESEGSSKMQGNDMYYYIEENYSQASDLQHLVVDVAKKSDLFYFDERTNAISINTTYLGELAIANFVKEKLSKNQVFNFDWEKFKEIKDGVLTDEQSNVLKEICYKDFVILNAPAGCGKTSTMMAVLDMFDYYNVNYRCMVAIGRGAKRLSEQTNRPASTIHRACMGDGVIGEDVLIIDEDSMLSLDLTLMVIQAIVNPSIKILFIGDVDQLPSIGVGRIVRDMMESGVVPTCTLTKCFRFNEGGMSMVSALVRESKFHLKQEQLTGEEITMGKNKDYKFVPFKGEMNQILEEYQKLIEKDIKPSEICLLTPHNIKDFGTIKINNAIQTLVNPPEPNETNMKVTKKIKKETYEICFRTGDLVMNVKNNYSVLTAQGLEEIKNSNGLLTKEDVRNIAVFNGEVGKVMSVTKDGLFIMFDEEMVVFSKQEAFDLLLAYASNPYKMQGSQNKYIIVLTISAHKRSLNKQLLYTALTRASQGVVEIGEIGAMRTAVSTIGDDRDTWLKDMLMDEENYFK